MLASPSFSGIHISFSSNPNQNQKAFKSHKSKQSVNEKPKFLVSKHPNSHSNVPVKMPTPPWTKGPLVLQPHELPNPSKPINRKAPNNDKLQKSAQALLGKESGVRGKKAMKKIIRSIEKLQEEHTQKGDIEAFEVGDWLERIGGDDEEQFGGKMPWSRDDKVVFRRKEEKTVTAAEMTLDKDLLERLRGKAVTMRKWVKVKKAGVTQEVVDQIRMAWRRDELAMVKFDIPLCKNMARAQEIVEMKTGGMVIWSKKDYLVIYRGSNHRLTSKTYQKGCPCSADGEETPLSAFRHLTSEKEIRTVLERSSRKDGEDESIPASIFMEEHEINHPINGSLYERETDRLLNGLGPRFIDWWMKKPLPVDADLLPEVVPGFKPPLRFCPPSSRSKLTDDELTYLRNLAHPLPFHFVLGRNRKLQGLATAILKLWEKSLIAKIAIKWGIPNTNNELMAYELKHLTGGILLLRNKYLIILFRGKDFLPCGVANLVAEREMALRRCHLNEEVARLKVIEAFERDDEPLAKTGTAGTLAEFQEIQTNFRHLEKRDGELDLELEVEKDQLEKELRNQERKLSILKIKIEESAKELAKLNSKWQPAEQDVDQEIITEEERECFQKVGMKLKSSLVLGRRGVFDGVIEGLHQHWKHTEVVKVITMQRVFSRVTYTAKMLEALSGGVLVSVDKLKEGHAIIIYRGKNYRRPLRLLNDNLLTKREALQKSLEMQRIGSLRFFAYQRQCAITDLKLKLTEIKDREEGSHKFHK